MSQSLPLCGGHRGDLVGDAVLAHHRPTGHEVAGGRDRAPAGTGRGRLRSRRGERFLDVAGGVGVRGAQPVQRVDDLSGQFVARNRQQIARHVGIAA